MSSNMRFLLLGYSGYATIAGFDTLMSSFSLSLAENVLQSGGVGRIFDEAEDAFSRLKLNGVRDYPGYEMSIACDATPEMLKYFLQGVRGGFRSFVDVSFIDGATGVSYAFDKCCLTSLTLNVSNNAQATVSFGFLTYRDTIEVNFGDYSVEQGREAPQEFVGNVLMPYWAWGADYPDFNSSDLYEFSVSYTQQVTPKYGCEGVISDNAVAPMKIVIGVPEVKYELTYMVATATDVQDYLLQSNKVAQSGKSLVVKYHKGDDAGFSLVLSDCYPDSFTPMYGGAGEASKMQIAGTVYGGVQYVGAS